MKNGCEAVFLGENSLQIKLFELFRRLDSRILPIDREEKMPNAKSKISSLGTVRKFLKEGT